MQPSFSTQLFSRKCSFHTQNLPYRFMQGHEPNDVRYSYLFKNIIELRNNKDVNHLLLQASLDFMRVIIFSIHQLNNILSII